MLNDMYTRIKEWFMDRPLPEGSLVKSSYRIEKVLGLGSYGISYLVSDLSSGKLRVLKQVRPSRLGTAKGRPLYEYEIGILSGIGHSQMPTLFDAFEEKQNLFYVMSYIEGKTLEDLLFEDGCTYDEQKSFQTIMDLLELVDYLHRKGIIHRDVRIPNVIWHEGKVYLIDFGLARYLGDSASYTEETTDGYWMEKRLKREVHPRSDLYALGHFMLFMLYSTYTNEDKKEESWEDELELSAPATHIIRRMLQLDTPYKSIEELREDIARHLASLNAEQPGT
ncbi:serine/threonine protein kinase [Aneurinibacillus tyrosinisolvens]|uniref:serine/threonine protein kinase n=1 Tax=Aneurinibacillus tyrosinisolvens TaxID=1443435 RepID=UPI000A6C193A|nr:protein kinase [Aneurinibacillus tyrosinisolvens]